MATFFISAFFLFPCVIALLFAIVMSIDLFTDTKSDTPKEIKILFKIEKSNDDKKEACDKKESSDKKVSSDKKES